MLDKFSLRAGWGTMYGFTKRVLALGAFILTAAVMVPLWSPAQNSGVLQYQVNENARKIQNLEGVPADIALIKERLNQMQASQRDVRDTVESLRTSISGAILAALAWAGVQLFKTFGGKFGREE